MKPEPGIYRDMPSAEYHALDAASASRLNKLHRSAAHCRYSIDHPEQTPAMAFGSMLHSLVLEPEAAAVQYAVAPACDRRTTVGKATWAEFCTANVRKTVVDGDEYFRACDMANAIQNHPAARALLDARTDTELSAVWRCRDTGVLCKLRTDGVCNLDGIGLALDLKTTEDASPWTFERTIFNYRYHVQGAHYLNGLAANGIQCESFVLIAVEKHPPYGVAVYRLRDDVLAVGGDEVAGLLKTYGKCEASGAWPCYSHHVKEIGIPAWAIRQYEMEAA